MTLAVTDIDRPDVNGVQPKMYEVESLAFAELYTDPMIPYMRIDCDDNIMSTVNIAGTFDPRELWGGGIWQNANYFQFAIQPEKEQRYYIAGEKVTIELVHKSHKIAAKFRKYTGTPEKAIAKIKSWIIENR